MSTAICAAVPLLALAEAAAAVFEAVLPSVTLAVLLWVVVVVEELVTATNSVVVPYAEAALQYCV
jgi:hypothetical protein